MGAGVSLSLPQNGFSVRHLFVVSGPFVRELGYPVDNHLVVEQVYYGSNLLEGVSLSVSLLSSVYYDFAVSCDAFPKIGLKADYGATSSNLPGSTPPSAVPGRYEKGFRPKVSLLGFGSGNFPLSLSISGSGLEASWSPGAKSGVTVIVFDTTTADAIPDDVAGCFTTVADHLTGALDSDLAVSGSGNAVLVQPIRSVSSSVDAAEAVYEDASNDSNVADNPDLVRSVTGERPKIRSVSGYVVASRADVVTDDMDISKKFMCAVDASSVGTVVAGKTRVADEDVGDPEDAGVERIWPSVCSLFRPHGFESSPCVDETVLPTLLLVSPISVLPFLSSPMNIPLLFLDLWKTYLRGFL